MQQTQLVALIQTLKPEERTHILHYAALPMFHHGNILNAQVISLMEFCMNHPWGPSEQKSEKNKAFEAVFPGQPFLEGKLEKLMVAAHKVVQTFLLTQRYLRKENEFQQQLDFADELRSRGLKSRYQQHMAKLRKRQEAAQHDGLYFHHNYLLEHSIYDEESIKNVGKGDLNIVATLHALEIDFYVRRLMLLNQWLLQNKITHLDIPEHLQVLLENDPIPVAYLSESPYLRINFEICSLLKKTHPTPAEVQSLLDLLLLYEQRLTPKSLRESYTFLRNLCVLALAEDYEQAELEQLLHQLYRDSVARGYLYNEGKVHRSRYFAIVNNALNVKEFDWALHFMNQHKDRLLDENETRDLYRLNMAHYLFRKGHFSECLAHLPDTSPFVDYLMVGKRLELKSLYELNSDLLPYKLDAFKMYLSRTSRKILSESQMRIHRDFANLLYQMVYSGPGDSKRTEILIRRIQERKQVVEWRWLMEKVREIED